MTGAALAVYSLLVDYLLASSCLVVQNAYDGEVVQVELVSFFCTGELDGHAYAFKIVYAKGVNANLGLKRCRVHVGLGGFLHNLLRPCATGAGRASAREPTRAPWLTWGRGRGRRRRVATVKRGGRISADTLTLTPGDRPWVSPRRSPPWQGGKGRGRAFNTQLVCVYIVHHQLITRIHLCSKPRVDGACLLPLRV